MKVILIVALSSGRQKTDVKGTASLSSIVSRTVV